jgi:hypothetical protein
MGMNSFSLRSAISDMSEMTEDLYQRLLNNSNSPVESPVDTDFASFFDSHKYEPVNLNHLEKGWTDEGVGRRRSPRYDLKVDVLICNQNRAFRTKTVDISLTGMQLSDLLPEEFSRGFLDIMLIGEHLGKKTYLLFRGKIVAGKLRERRIVFESLASDSAEGLIRLIDGLVPKKVAA